MIAAAASITRRQAELLEIVAAGLLRDGYQPSYIEIAAQLGGRNPYAIWCRFDCLARKGYVEPTRKGRAIRLLLWPDGGPFAGLRPILDPGDVADPAVLTPPQRDLHAWLFGELLRNGYQPSTREAQVATGCSSPNGVTCHLRGLARMGFLARARGDHRAIRFLRVPRGARILGYGPAREGGATWA
jgi:SOS-response transcriptional repressor LexA